MGSAGKRVSVFDRLGPRLQPPESPTHTPPRLVLLGSSSGSEDEVHTKGSGQSILVNASARGERKVQLVVTSPEAETPESGSTSARRPARRASAKLTPCSRLLVQSLQQVQRSRQDDGAQPPSPTGSSSSSRGGPAQVLSPASSLPATARTASSSKSRPQTSRGGQQQQQQQQQPPPQQQRRRRRSAAGSGVSGGSGYESDGGPSPAATDSEEPSGELHQRLEQLQAERQVAEELAEQMRRQAEALMAEKARIQAENYALLKEKTNLLERLEYMEQVSSQDPDAFDNGSVLGSPEKGAPHDAQELREQLQVLRQEREELLQLLEGAFEGLQLQQEV